MYYRNGINTLFVINKMEEKAETEKAIKTKICKICNLDKEVTNFHKNGTT